MITSVRTSECEEKSCCRGYLYVLFEDEEEEEEDEMSSEWRDDGRVGGRVRREPREKTSGNHAMAWHAMPPLVNNFMETHSTVLMYVGT